jgi:anti-anti-sigma regulatory factor
MSPSPENLSETPAAGMPIVLPVALLITDARSFAEGLRQAVAHGDVSVDASGLRDIDTAGLQLLLATRLAAIAAGHEFRWVAESTGLRTAATAIGLTQALGLAA